MVKDTLSSIKSRRMSSNSDDEGIGNCQAADVQSWWEVPCIAHFCSLFRLYFELVDFDIEELEEALITDGVEDSRSSLLQDLIVRLLRGCFNAGQDEITSSNYQMYLRRLFRIKCEEDPTKNNPFDGDVAFHSLPLRTKVEILRDLCDFRLDNEDVSEALKTLEAASLRVEPLGQDSGGSTYWYFYGTRLYREDYASSPVSQPARRRGRRKQEPKQISVNPELVTKWQVVCFTEQDWQILTQKFKNCKSTHERNLYQTLIDDFLPELPRLFAEKEKLQRKRMLEQQLRRNGRSSSFLADKDEPNCNGAEASTSSSSVNGCGGASGSSVVNGVGAGCSSSSSNSSASGTCNGVFGGIVIGSSKPNRIRSSRTLSVPVKPGGLVFTSISHILDKSSIVGIGLLAGASKSAPSAKKKGKVGKPAKKVKPVTNTPPPAICSTSKALRGGYNENSWCPEDDDDNNNKISAMDLDDEHSERECSPPPPPPAEPDEDELRRRREEQERADRLLAEALEREERKARLHLRERRGGGTFSSPSNAGSRNSSSVSTERPQSIKTSTVSKQTVAAAVSKKGTKASPVKSSPVKKKSGSKSKSKNEKKSGRMTNNSLSVSLSPLVDNEDEDDEEDGETGEKKKKKKKKRKHQETEDPEDGDFEQGEGDGDEEEDGGEADIVPKKKSKSLKSGNNSPKKVISKKKKKHSKVLGSRSPSPATSRSPPLKKMKKSKTSPKTSKKKAVVQPDEQEEIEEENQMDVDDEDDDDDFVEEEEEADYESIVARTLHNNNNHKVKEKTGKERAKSKEKVRSKEKKRSVSSGDDEVAASGKKSGKEKLKDGSKKIKKSTKSGKIKEKDPSKKSKSSKSESTSSSGLIGASSINLGSGTSKTKVKSSVLFSQSEEDVQIGMHKVIESIKNHRDAWPFINPVDEDYAPNYYKIIDHPMDLQTMEDKLDNQEYSSLEEFKLDFARIVDNCRKYNGPINEYTEMVETVEQAFNKLLQRYITPDESDEEISIEYTNATSAERKRSSSKSLKKKDKEASSKSGGVETSSLVSKEHKKENEPAASSPPKKSSSSKLSSSSSTSKGDAKEKEKLERKKKKQQLMRHHSKDSEVIENLSFAAAETLKDINKCLGDTPKPPELYGGAASSSGEALSETVTKAKVNTEAIQENSKPKAAKIFSPSTSTSPSPVIKKTKKILSSTTKESTSTTATPPVGHKRKLEFSSNKKARSTQFIMDEDDEYNIDRDLSPPPPKITKKKEDGQPGKVKGSKKGKLGPKGDKKDGVDGKGKEKGKKDKHHHHHHKHHHHHHHHHKRDGSSTEKESGMKSKTGNFKKSASMSSSSSVTSSMSASSSSIQPKPKVKKNATKSGNEDGATTKKPKSAKRPAGGIGSTGNLLNTLKNSAAYKRMNQISRATKALSSSESPKLKSDSLAGVGTPQVAGATVVDAPGVGTGTSGIGAGDAAEKKKCILLSDLPADKEGGPKLSLGSVLSTDAIKLVNLKEIEDEPSDEDEFVNSKPDEGKSDKDAGDPVKKEGEEEDDNDEEEVNRKLEPSKGFNREKCMPNLSAWIKAFGGPAKNGSGGTAPGNGTPNATTQAPVSPLISPIKKPDPDSKNKFRVMGRGVGEPDVKSHTAPSSTKPIVPPPSSSHHPSVIKTSAAISPLSSAVPVVRHHSAITDPVAPSWSPLTPLPGLSPSATSNPMLNPIKQAALVAAERSSTGLGGTIGEDLSSPPRAHSHHSSKKHRNRKMSSSSLSSQSESGSPLCISGQDGIGGSGSGSYISGGGTGGVVVNPPRWVEDHPWGPVSQSQSPSASSHVSSQSPAGPNSPFSPSIASPPPSTPQTPPRPVAPIRAGFYQDITASQHSSPEKVNESQSSPATPPTPNSVHGSASSGGSGGSTSNANNNTGSSSRRGTSGSGGNRESGYPSSNTPHYAPKYLASTPSPNVSGGPASNASSGLPSPSTPPASNASGGIAESPGNPNSPHSPKVVNMSSTSSGGGGGNSSGATDYRSHSSSGGSGVATTSSLSSIVNGPQTPAHQQSSRSGATSVLHSSSPYGTPAAHHHFSSASIMEQHLRNSPVLHQLPDPAHSHHLHSPSSGSHSHLHQTPAHAHSNAPQTSHVAHAHSLGHLGQPQQAHVGSSSNQYHESPSRGYPPNLPHAHQQSSIANTSSTSSSTYSGSVSGGSTTSHQNLAQAHAHSRQPTSQPHLPYPTNPYTSNPRNINVAPNVYNSPISADAGMSRFYKAAIAAASAGGGGSELSLTIGSSGGSSSSTTSAGATNPSSSSSSSSTKRSSRSNASANAAPSPHPEIPRSASVNPTAAAAVAAALEGKLGHGDLANGFWPHNLGNLASLSQIVNSIPGAYRHYADPESMSKYQRAAAAAAAAQQESNSYPVSTSSSSGASVIISGSAVKSGGIQSGGGAGGGHHHHHHHHSSSSEKSSGGSGANNANDSSHHHHHIHHHHSDSGSSVSVSGSSSKKQSKSSSSESKSSRSQSNAGGKSSSSSSGGGIVPGSAFNFSSLTPDSLALYSKEMSDAAASSLYSSSSPALTPPLAHRASEFYPTASSASHFSHHSFSAAARTTAGGVPTPPITPYPFIPGSHPSPYQAHQSTQPFAAHSQSSRGLDPYQQLFQGSPHVMGLLSHPSGYPAPYAHPHSSLGFNRPGGWI